MSKYKYWFLDAVYDEAENNLYFWGTNVRGLFKWNLNLNEVYVVDSMEKYAFTNQMYMNGIIHKDKIYFPPRMATQMAVYDLKNENLDMYDLYNEEMAELIKFHPSPNGHHIVKVEDNRIYFMYRDVPICVIWDTEVKAPSYIFNDDVSFSILARDFSNVDNIFYFPSVSDNSVLKLDINKKKISQRLISECEGYAFNSILTKRNNIWLHTINGDKLVKWDTENNSTKILKNHPVDSQYGHNYCMINKDDIILMIPQIDDVNDLNNIIEINAKTGAEEKKEVFEKYIGYKKWRTFRIKDKQGYMFYKSPSMGWLEEVIFVCLDLVTETVKEFELPIPQGWDEEMLSKKVAQCQMENLFSTIPAKTVYESDIVTLSRYLDAVR